MAPQEKLGGSYDRKIIADQIRKARKSERENNDETYTTERSGKEYFYRIGGLQHLFGYLKGLSSNKVLDVGAGNANASRMISKMPISSGLDFNITVLQNTQEVSKNFPKEKIYITGVETLAGIENKSLAGVIGVNSIAYSNSPELAVRKLDEVLIPGGVVKATFCRFGGSENCNGLVFKGPMEFVQYFAKLGYDVSIIAKNNFSTPNIPLSFVNSIILAIKPGNPNAPSADNLLHLDFDAIKSEALEYKEGAPVYDIND